MPSFIDLTGERFGRWTVIDRAGAEFAWNCKCDCGTRKKVGAQSLRRGDSTSCGCFQREEFAKKRYRLTHGAAGIDRAPEYSVWSSMKDRCGNPKTKNFGDYGGRGIKVCERWLSFENFADDMGPRPEGHSIERRDNNGNYEPGNCFWATRLEQNRNTRRNRFLTHNDETKCITEWTALKGFKENTIRQRLFMGWEVSRAIETPIRLQKPRKRK